MSNPWDSEPNIVTFVHAELPCLLIRNAVGAWCGYVALPVGHPYHGTQYDDLRHIKVHGDLTFSGTNQHRSARAGVPEDVWWLGFDCNHVGDLSPCAPNLSGTYRTVNYAWAECKKLAEQLAAAPKSAPPPTDLPPGALEEMERLLKWEAQWELSEALVDHAETLLALAREAPTLRERARRLDAERKGAWTRGNIFRMQLEAATGKSAPPDPSPGSMHECFEERIREHAEAPNGTPPIEVYNGEATMLAQIIDAERADKLALRERVAGLTASLDACQEGHTQQAKRAEAAEARVREFERYADWRPVGPDAPVSADMLVDHFLTNAASIEGDKCIDGEFYREHCVQLRAMADFVRQMQAEAARLRAVLEVVEPRIHALIGCSDAETAEIEEIEESIAAALRPAAPAKGSCQGLLDNCGPTETEEKDQSHG